MLDCANANSLFELGFGASAGIALLNEQVRKARSRFLSKYLSAMLVSRTDLERKTIDTSEVHKSILAVVPQMRWIIYGAGALQMAAGFLAVVSIVTLLQLAHWGSSCEIHSTQLVIYCIFAFLLLPLLFWAYPILIAKTTVNAIERGIPRSVEFVASLVSLRQLSARMTELMLEQATLVAKLAETQEPVEHFQKRFDEVERELESLGQMERSFNGVLDGLRKLMRSDA